MISIKKPFLFVFYSLFIISLLGLNSCCGSKYKVYQIEAKALKIEEKYNANSKIDSFVKPYREKIDADLNTVLAFAPQTFDKNGIWQTSIGNLIATITFEKANTIFEMRNSNKVDFCILNNGGIRSIIPQGNVTLKTAYEIQPFENTAVVVALKGDVVLALLQHIIKDKKPHPVAGITFTIDKENQPQNILIQNKKFDVNQTYLVATSDYLSNGGDKMDFFLKKSMEYNLDYKLRNMLIDYFKEVDTLPILNDIRISKE